VRSAFAAAVVDAVHAIPNPERIAKHAIYAAHQHEAL
jgi:hypothetical protein